MNGSMNRKARRTPIGKRDFLRPFSAGSVCLFGSGWCAAVTNSNEQEQSHANPNFRNRQQGVVLRPARLLRPHHLLCADGLLRPDRLLRPVRLLCARGLLRPNAVEGRLR